jgi:hypothetical protein
MSTLRRAAACAVLGAMAAACGARPTDTGYNGTFARGNDRSRSMVHLIHNERGAWAKLNWRTDNESWIVDCDWDGRCTLRVNGEESGSYQYRVWEDPATRHLMLECHVKYTRPEVKEFHFVDELVLREGGLKLLAYTVEKEGQKLAEGERPVYFFDKLSDEVPEPPPEATGS